jgi:hypothetical protein
VVQAADGIAILTAKEVAADGIAILTAKEVEAGRFSSCLSERRSLTVEVESTTALLAPSMAGLAQAQQPSAFMALLPFLVVLGIFYLSFSPLSVSGSASNRC